MGHERPARRERSEPAPAITVCYLPRSDAEALRDDPHVLAAVHFACDHWVREDRPRSFGVGVPLLDASADTVEVWRSAAPSRATQIDGVVLLETDICVFGHLLVDESREGGLQAATRSAYERILTALRARGYPYLLRIWHFFPRITSVAHDMERYQTFCVGRHQALSSAAEFERSLPAATAIGCQGDGLLLYFIAATSPGLQVENPRQVSAFDYPRQYGPESPSFSRAMLQHWPQGDALYISGTASVVGHASRHRHDLAAQVDEIARNLRALTEGTDERSARRGWLAPENCAAKVYVRKPQDQPRIAALLTERLGHELPTLYLQGDICRSELLLEVEATCTGFAQGSSVFSS